MKQLEEAMKLDEADASISKAKLEVIQHANSIVDSLEQQQKEAEENANKEAEERVLQV